jgi:pyridoxamine 5'-phosphate oxidase
MAQWLDEAQAESGRRNPLAMALATSTATGVPNARMVLAKGFDKESGHITFYTHFSSRKGQELAATAHAAAVFYWEAFGGRQLRISGPVTRAPEATADAYFATRPAASQLNAWVSEQSQPIADPDLLTTRLADKAKTFGVGEAQLAELAPADIPRPKHWGGFQLWVEQVEFWTEGVGRFHERWLYQRSRQALEQRRGGADVWRLTRLQP